MVKIEYFKHYNTKQISAAITLLFCIFFLPAITFSAFLPPFVNAGSGAEDSQSSDMPGAEPAASLQEDIHLERKTTFFSKNTLINMQLFLENFVVFIYAIFACSRRKNLGQLVIRFHT